MLHEDILREIFYPNLEETHFWSTDWDPVFYVALARAGFISISQRHPDLGAVLIAELQDAYAVLDWPNLHVSGHVRKIIRSGRLEDEGIELRIVDDCRRVLKCLLAYHGPRTWLSAPYCALLPRLPADGDFGFALRGTELWSMKGSRGAELIAGELGYTIGGTYTSLSGFCTRPDRTWRHFGTLQIVLLAQRLRDLGFAFWNMGHPHHTYKRVLGARVIPREEFLERWCAARNLKIRLPSA